MRASTPEGERLRRLKISQARQAREAARRAALPPTPRVRGIDLPRTHRYDELPQDRLLGWLPVAGTLIPVLKKEGNKK